jgi:dTDP-4-amino-4,6-dideoxygalactose transaminase
VNVPLLDLQAQYAGIRDEVRRVIDEVCDSQSFILGPQVAALEKEVAAYCQCAQGIGVSSGTDALLVALMALDIGPGDEVIVPTFSFFASAGSVARLGATPVFVDVEADTFNINPAAIARALTPRTRAIMPVHLFGQCADMDAILALARQHHLPVIEDAAQAIGAEYKGRRAGSLGTIGCFSFFPSKNLGGFGDGGMVTTNDGALAEKMRCLRVHGMQPKYYHQLVGGNFRLDALQAAVLRVKLKHLDAWTARRQANAARYDALLADTRVTTPVAVWRATGDRHYHIYNQYTLRSAHRDRLMNALKAANVGHEIYYPLPLHLQKCFAGLGGKAGDCPVAETLAREVVALPIYPELTPDQIEYSAHAVKQASGG